MPPRLPPSAPPSLPPFELFQRFVYKLDLADNGLNGTLTMGARSICDLPYLRHLDLSGNDIKQLPLSDACFQDLRTVHLAHTAITGPLPRWITRSDSQLHELDIVRLMGLQRMAGCVCLRAALMAPGL